MNSRIPLALLCGLALVACKDGVPSRITTRVNPYSQKFHEPMHRPVAVVSLDALLSEFRDNEFAAAANYQANGEISALCLSGQRSVGCRFIQTTAAVLDSRRESNGIALIRLSTANPLVSVEARFVDAEDPAVRALQRNQRVSVVCLVLYDHNASSQSTGVLLTRCQIAPKRQ